MNKVAISILGLFIASISFTAIAETVPSSDPTKVEVFYPKSEVYKKTIELSGTIVAKQDAQLAPLESGLVKSIFVEAGDKVDKGQALLGLDDTLAKLRLIQVQADFKSAEVQREESQRQYDEVVSLAKRKVVAGSLLAERKATLASAEAALANVKAQVALQQEVVKRHTLTAPFKGVIAQRNVDIGEWISQQNQIFHLVSHKSLRLIVDLPQEHLSALSQNSQITAEVIPDALNELTIKLPVSNIVAVSESVSRTVQIRIDLPETAGIIPGMSARTRLNLSADNKHLVWLPKTAIKRHPDGGSSAFAVENDRLKRYTVNLIRTQSDLVAVTGLPANAAVVLNGAEVLTDNQLVLAVNSERSQ